MSLFVVNRHSTILSFFLEAVLFAKGSFEMQRIAHHWKEKKIFG